jgi:hypothetical protein
MKTRLIIILFVIIITDSFSQTDTISFKKNINELNSKISKLASKIDTLTYKEDINELNRKISALENTINEIQISNKQIIRKNKSFDKSQSVLKKNYKRLLEDFDNYKIKTKAKTDSLQGVITTNFVNINKTTDELSNKIENAKKSTNQSITELSKTVSQNTLYWIIAILVVALLVLLVFVLLRKQIFKQKTDLDSNLQDTRKVLEEEGVKLDNKLIEVLETQLKIINSSNLGTEKEADHSLALKVADEIIRIQKNLNRMDEKTKGLKQLTASVKRIQDNFASNGYEIVEMLGKIYNDGMKASVTYNPDSEEEAGIIIRIIKPQVNYEEVMIQSGQIEVSE